MRNTLLLGLVLCELLLFTGCSSQPVLTYAIRLEIPGCVDCKAYLKADAGTYKAINSAQSSNGRFLLTGQVDSAGIYTVYCLNRPQKLVYNVKVYLPADSVKITATPNLRLVSKFRRLYQGVNTGSHLRMAQVISTAPLQQDLETYLVLRDSLWNQYFLGKDLVVAKMTQTFDSGNQALIAQWADSVKRYDSGFKAYLTRSADLFVQQHPSSIVALYAMDKEVDMASASRFKRYYYAMPDSLQRSVYGKMLRQQLDSYLK
ncbi:DUF4369 domain-containing protein [Hymenobacter sp. YC55]|uniref:DUF4369 domain-containing protein n=1 Tax=Hymenobacter sp. YC55 TaxID=3034019 RepID=UPI0023F6454D|nr:DUF4369 domain-containing protein [Hymenobacter sp. YC55]MDF7813049.1 DUF4369 domain-containing protein [Hymenobacter sp. YC55]